MRGVPHAGLRLAALCGLSRLLAMLVDDIGYIDHVAVLSERDVSRFAYMYVSLSAASYLGGRAILWKI